MRPTLAVLAAAALLATGPVAAQDGKRLAADRGHPAMPAGHAMDMSAQMDEHMQMMKALHEKLQAATTPEARQILLARQQEEMDACMGMMDAMHQHGKAMGGAAMPHGHPAADAPAPMEMLQKRVEMMELMMQSMMDRQRAAAATGAPVR